MQEEIEHKTVNFAISTVKLSARTLLKGAQFFLRQYDKSASQGKQSESAHTAEPGCDQSGNRKDWHQGF